MQDDLTLYAQPTARQALGLAVVATGGVLNGLALLHWIAG